MGITRKTVLFVFFLACICLCTSLAISVAPSAEAHAASKAYKIVYKLNGGSWPGSIITKSSVASNAAVMKIYPGSRIKVSTIAKPLRFGYTFSGWYKTKSSKKKATVIKGAKRLSSRTIYAKWKKTKNPYSFVKTKGKVDKACLNDAVSALKKHKKLTRRFYNAGGTIVLCDEIEYSNMNGPANSAGFTRLSGSSFHDFNVVKHYWSNPTIYLRAEWGSSEELLMHEIGHWYHIGMQSEKTKTRIKSLYKTYKEKIGKNVSDYASTNVLEAYAETFSAIKCNSLDRTQIASLGKWYTFVKSTIRH